MTSAAETAKRLIALAVNPGAAECEARNAALAACKLIAKHGLFAEAEPAERAKRKPRAPKKPHAETAVCSKGWVQFPSRWHSTCGTCGAAILEGDRVWWRKGERARCSDCGRP